MLLGTFALLATRTIANALSNKIPVFSENETWIENLDVRRSNGYILPATASGAVLYQVDPVTRQQQVVYDFSDYGDAIMSIAAMGPDLFVINTMYCDIYQLECTPGTGITWSVDLRKQRHRRGEDWSARWNWGWKSNAKVKQLAKGPDPKSLLNGAAALNDRIALMVDQNLGGIWAVDVGTGNPRLVVTDPTMSPTFNGSQPQGNGVNGIRVRPGVLYYNNPSQGILARIPIDPKTGEKRGKPTIIASGLSPDDFEIDEQKGFAYIVDPDHSQLLKISLENGTSQPVADGLAGPTTARWKEYGKSLYVATTGGYDQWLAGDPSIPAVVYEINV